MWNIQRVISLAISHHTTQKSPQPGLFCYLWDKRLVNALFSDLLNTETHDP